MPRLPVRLEAETVTKTDFGGRVSAWTVLAVVWVDFTLGPEREIVAGDAPPLRIETATAVARDDARVLRGRRLRIGDAAPWTVLSVDHAHPAPARMTLRLERGL